MAAMDATPTNPAVNHHTTTAAAQWINRFTQLPPVFYTRLQPTPMPQLRMRAANAALAADMGLPEGWLASDEAAQVLGVAEADVLAEIQAGNLKARQIGSQWRIAQAALDEFLRG